ncbi:MAG: hypothetical protein KJ905_03620 [Nanoarchaeota archaeon]|nr:hypothetical protein [Nanoarchaeota archaeon]MBU1501829.1 hypothetical protein [Nanoarchaeota archaeon]MBU2459358.1 hypothetical protein [Nanoarchaeota archaeon]
MVKNILFVCKHNIFRSRAAEEFFKKFNKNKKYRARSAGMMKWHKRDLDKDRGYAAEKKVAKEFGINLKVESKSLDSAVLKKTDIIVITADDVPASMFKENLFKMKLIVWKIRDVKVGDKNKEEIARKILRDIEIKVGKFVRDLK